MELSEKKEHLINSLISKGHLRTEAVIRAFQKVPRENFVPLEMKKYAYVDEPLPIGEGQTISQPLTVADMTEALNAKPGQKILEIGTGSGYQAAILCSIVGPGGRVISTERIGKLAKFASENLEKLGCKNVFVVLWDGSQGYEEEAPYDRIIVTASSPTVPLPLTDQLKKGGKMVIPVGNEMLLIEKDAMGRLKKKSLGYYVFVPLIGKHGHKF
jgi:protein-L-isoaspartate(D-aspartate) O-methyltransferase